VCFDERQQRACSIHLAFQCHTGRQPDQRVKADWDQVVIQQSLQRLQQLLPSLLIPPLARRANAKRQRET